MSCCNTCRASCKMFTVACSDGCMLSATSPSSTTSQSFQEKVLGKIRTQMTSNDNIYIYNLSIREYWRNVQVLKNQEPFVLCCLGCMRPVLQLLGSFLKSQVSGQQHYDFVYRYILVSSCKAMNQVSWWPAFCRIASSLSSDGSKHKTWSIFWSGRRYLKWNLTWAGRQPLCLFNQGSLPLPCLCESLIQQSSPYFAAVHSSLVLSHDAISDSLWCVQIQQTMCQSARI